MELLERDEALAELHRQFETSATVGRLVVVSGEAGIGKTALVSGFLGECVPAPVVLWGGCTRCAHRGPWVQSATPPEAQGAGWPLSSPRTPRGS